MKKVSAGSMFLGVFLVLSTIGTAQTIVFDQRVVIPFALNGMGRAEVMNFNFSQGDYYIELKVENASWDRFSAQVPAGQGSVGWEGSLNDLVPIGMEAWEEGRYDVTEWRSAAGFVSQRVTIGPHSTLRVRFSTAAPLGARGILMITRLNEPSW